MSLLIYRGHIGSERNQRRRTPCHITSTNYNHVGPPSLLFPRSSVSMRRSALMLCSVMLSPLPAPALCNLLIRASQNLYVTHLHNKTLLYVCFAIFSQCTCGTTGKNKLTFINHILGTTTSKFAIYVLPQVIVK